MSTVGWSVVIEKGGMKEELGPVSDAELVKLARDGVIRRVTGIYHPAKTKGKWVRADQIPALRQIFEKLEEQAESSQPAKAAPPPPPPQSHTPHVGELMPAAPAPQPAPFQQPVVVVAGPQPNAPLGAGGWFARSFAVVMGYMVAVTVVIVGSIAVVFFLCCGGLAIFSNSVGDEILRKERERQAQEAAKKGEPTEGESPVEPSLDAPLETPPPAEGSPVIPGGDAAPEAP